MQDVIETQSPAQPISIRGITYEWLLYAFVLGLAVVLRLADLNAVAIGGGETHNALAAWRAAVPNASGSALVASSPLLFILQTFSFSTLGGSEFVARLAIALLGAGLVITPLLFRPLLGKSQSAIFAVLLAFSPSLLAASRFSSPVIISLWLAVLLLWCIYRLSATRHGAYGIGAITASAALIFLAEAGGPVLLLLLAISAFAAIRWERAASTRRFDFEEPETAGESTPSLISTVPWGIAVAIAALVVFLVATVFVLYPAGLNSLGELLSGTIQGFLGHAGQPAAFPLFVSVFYEPFIWILGISGLIVILRQDRLTLVDRFLALWFLTGTAASALFSGGTSAHALWTVIPLTGLAARLTAELLRVDTAPSHWDVPVWARFAVAMIALALLAVFTLAVHDVARSLMYSVSGQIWTAPIEPSSLILLLVVILFSAVSVFLASGLWNVTTVLRGIGLALLCFGAVTSLGSGWRLAVPNAGNPLEPWHLNATNNDLFLLTESLDEVADRQSNGFDLMPVSLLTAQNSRIAWAARHFPNAVFIREPSEAVGAPVVVIDSNIIPDLGGAYVGQDFSVAHEWSMNSLSLTDLLSWWTKMEVGGTSKDSQSIQTAYLWLRQDVWQGSNNSNPIP